MPQTEIKPCPECGKPMAEAQRFKGLWVCPDGKVRLNNSAPFRFKCYGIELTDAGAEALEMQMLRLLVKLN